MESINAVVNILTNSWREEIQDWKVWPQVRLVLFDAERDIAVVSFRWDDEDDEDGFIELKLTCSTHPAPNEALCLSHTDYEGRKVETIPDNGWNIPLWVNRRIREWCEDHRFHRKNKETDNDTPNT